MIRFQRLGRPLMLLLYAFMGRLCQAKLAPQRVVWWGLPYHFALDPLALEAPNSLGQAPNERPPGIARELALLVILTVA